jgi:phosphoglycolate phosphatase
MQSVSAIFFDVDGVLVDSLEAHLQICRDKNREFGLKLKIPTARQLREMVSRGVRISPMKEFFVAVGFPETFAEKADADYRRDFAAKYAVKPFPGVKRMLLELARTGVALGLVTSNTRAIVAASLGDAARVFRSDLRFTIDHPKRLGKAEALIAGARKLRVLPSAVLYVGDQPKDLEAARAAGTQFLGVTFGWGISGKEKNLDTVDTIPALGRALRARVQPPAVVRRSRRAAARA